MNESTLLRFSIIFSLLGLLVIFLVSSSVDRTTVKKLFLEEESIEVSGKIKDISHFGTSTVLVIEEMNERRILVYDDIELELGQHVTVEGKGDEEIIAERIIVID